MALSTAEATMDLTLLHADAETVSFHNIAADLAAKNLPLEIVTRMQWLWDSTKMIAGELISIGKIIVIKIWEFIKANPHMAIGVAIGALVGLIPFVGSYLAPIAILIGGFIGGLEGHEMDRILRGDVVTGSMIQNMISMAKEFYKLFAEIFIALKDHYFAN